jgi:hypothetical protein
MVIYGIGMEQEKNVSSPHTIHPACSVFLFHCPGIFALWQPKENHLNCTKALFFGKTLQKSHHQSTFLGQNFALL